MFKAILAKGTALTAGLAILLNGLAAFSAPPSHSVLNKLRPATVPEVTAALRHDEVRFNPVSNKIMVATQDFGDISPSLTPMTILVPHGIRWTGKRMGYAVLLLQAKSLRLAEPYEPDLTYIDAVLLYDTWCYGVFMRATTPQTCEHPAPLPPESDKLDISHLRYPETPEEADTLGTRGAHISTRSFVATPDVDGPRHIMLDYGHKITGGQLGFDVITVRQNDTTFDRWKELHNPFCQAMSVQQQSLNENFHFPLQDYLPPTHFVEYNKNCPHKTIEAPLIVSGNAPSEPIG